LYEELVATGEAVDPHATHDGRMPPPTDLIAGVRNGDLRALQALHREMGFSLREIGRVADVPHTTLAQRLRTKVPGTFVRPSG
jgi:hypothetical protein